MRAKRRKPPVLVPMSDVPEGSIIDQVFGPIYGRSCWNLQPGYGCSLTFEFGKPHLEIWRPREPVENVADKHRPHKYRRQVEPRGQWHLWIRGCNWRANSNGEWSGASDTKLSMGMAAETLAGQKLVRVSYERERVSTIFDFDLGGSLVVEPDGFERDDPSDIWSLF